MRFKKFSILFVLIVMVGLFTACSQKSVKVNDEEVKNYSEPILESILMAANKDDYSTYSKDFSDKMKEALTETNFKEHNKVIKDKIGEYKSKQFVKVQAKGDYITAIYSAKYSNEPKDVMVTVTFKTGDENHKVEGLFMTSPKLASK